MRYIVDNDLHIHSHLSSCSRHSEQTPERILEYAKDNGIKTAVLTDHFWDDEVAGASPWYKPQNLAHISRSLPLPQAEGVRFLFGCETELDKNFTLGISKKQTELFDFIVIPTTHMHMKGFTISDEDFESQSAKARLWAERLDAVLSMDLPFHKIGIAHLNTQLISKGSREQLFEIFDMIPTEEMERLFTKAARLGVGIELNYGDMMLPDAFLDAPMRMFRIAKECGCKFYFASDAHSPSALNAAKEVFEKVVDALGLTEEDKFVISNHNKL